MMPVNCVIHREAHINGQHIQVDIEYDQTSDQALIVKVSIDNFTTVLDTSFNKENAGNANNFTAVIKDKKYYKVLEMIGSDACNSMIEMLETTFADLLINQYS